MSQDFVAVTDPKLLRRLLRPIERPGVIDTGMGWEIVARSQQFTNRLPLLSHITKRWNRKVGFQGEEIPIVYAQLQPQETPTTRSISAGSGQSPSNQRMVVQAKFVSGSDRANRLVQKTNNLAGDTPTPQQARNFKEENFFSSQPMVVQAKFATGSDRTNRLVQKTNNLAGDTPTPQQARNFKEENFSSSQPMVVQAKFATGSDRSFSSSKLTAISTTQPIDKSPLEQSLSLNSPDLFLETKTIDLDRQVEDLSGESIQNVRPIARVRPASDRIISPGTNLPSVQESIGEAILPTQGYTNAFDTSTLLPNLSGETTQNPLPQKRVALSKIQKPIAWSGLETPLVFSHPRVNTESVQKEFEVPNSGITRISRTKGITQTTELSREISPNLQFDRESNIQQPHRQDSFNSKTPIDLEALTDKVERQIIQRLIIETERRGKKIWS